MDSKHKNYNEKWVAMRKEHDARSEKLSAKQRIEYNNAFNDFGKEVSAVTDWTGAAWDEFSAKVNQRWQDFSIDRMDRQNN
jgi:hypothetical protein